MSERPVKPQNMPWVTPYLVVRDAAAAAEFYAKAFPFEKGMLVPGEGGKVMHAELNYRGLTVVMLGPEGACPQKSPASSGAACPIGLYVYVDDADAAYKQALDAGCKPVAGQEPQTAFWGDRIATVADPEGYQWTLATNVADFDPSKAPK